jgi:hypothetical protein
MKSTNKKQVDIKKKIEESNKIWSNSSTLEKRVILAKEVLFLIDSERLGTSENKSAYMATDWELSENLSIGEFLSDTNLPPCNVCIRGSLLAARLLHNGEGGKTPMRSLKTNVDMDFNNAGPISHWICDKIEDVFDAKTQDLMELFFETSTFYFMPIYYKRSCKDFHDFDKWTSKASWFKSISKISRIRIILNNIIDNNGEFVPSKIPSLER